MERIVKKLDSSHDEWTLVAQSATERDLMYRLFPHPPLPTHRLVCEWDGDMKVKLRQEPIPKGEPANPATPTAPANPLDALPAETVAKVRGMKPADLETFAAEQGMVLPENFKKRSPAQQSAAVLTFLAEKQAK